MDGAYRFTASSKASRAKPLPELLAKDGEVFGAVAAPLLLERLGISPGAEFSIGNARIRVGAYSPANPNALSDGFGFAPRLMISSDALALRARAAGSLVDTPTRSACRIPADVPLIRVQARRAFPPPAGRYGTSGNAAPSLTCKHHAFLQFLTLVGLDGADRRGVGVANAVRSYLDGKRSVIATFKCLGAPASAGRDESTLRRS